MLFGNKIRVAVIDDDEDDFLIISDYIHAINRKQFTIDWFKDYATAIEKIRNREYQIYFVDYFLGSKTGLDLLKEAMALKCDRPIVLLTGFGSKDIDIRAMQSGATDYLVKSELNSEKLERCMRYALDRSAFLNELKVRENKYRNLFESSKDAVFIADTDLVFTEVNYSALQLLYSTNGRLTGRSFYDFIPDAVQKARIADLVKSSGNIDDLEIKVVDDAKEVKHCLLSLYVQPDNDKVPHVHGIVHDITKIKKAELANLQAEKLAANERLIRMLAHEIRNPLNNIILSTEHLMPESDDDPRKDFLDIIKRNSIRVNQIITELLNMASPTELVFEKHTLQDIMEESLAQASDRISLNKIQVEKSYPDDPLMIDADKKKLVIAFTNILINAVEAMEVNKGNLNIRLCSTKDDHNIIIQDNGSGIPKEYMTKLFDPFFTMKKNGTGLGLTASYLIIQSHKAKLQVESAVDEGTKFQISFSKV